MYFDTVGRSQMSSDMVCLVPIGTKSLIANVRY